MDDQSARAVRTLLKLNRVSVQFLDSLWNFDTSACMEKHDITYALSCLVMNEMGAVQEVLPPHRAPQIPSAEDDVARCHIATSNGGA